MLYRDRYGHGHPAVQKNIVTRANGTDFISEFRGSDELRPFPNLWDNARMTEARSQRPLAGWWKPEARMAENGSRRVTPLILAPPARMAAQRHGPALISAYGSLCSPRIYCFNKLAGIHAIRVKTPVPLGRNPCYPWFKTSNCKTNPIFQPHETNQFKGFQSLSKRFKAIQRVWRKFFIFWRLPLPRTSTQIKRRVSPSPQNTNQIPANTGQKCLARCLSPISRHFIILLYVRTNCLS